MGDTLLRLLGGAEEEALVVAPFMKAGPAARVLQVVRPTVPVRCFTRWRPEEVAAGVSDLQVADLMEERDEASVCLVTDLHGKLFCTESECLVTSANLTDSGLGWRSPANLEVGTLVLRNNPSIVKFEESLNELAVAATAEIREAVQVAAAALSEQIATPSAGRVSIEYAEQAVGLGPWTPSCLVPASLYDLYRGWDVDISRQAASDGFRDLEVLDLPLGLSEGVFNKYVRSVLLQHPKLSEIIGRAMKAPLIAETAQQDLGDLVAPHVESTEEAFRIVGAWIAHFFSGSLVLGRVAGRDVLMPRQPMSSKRITE